MLNAAGTCRGSGEEEAGRETCPLSKTGHELGACTCSLGKCTAWARGREFYRESQLSLSANNAKVFSSKAFISLNLLSQQPAVKLRLQSRGTAALGEPCFMGNKSDKNYLNHMNHKEQSSTTLRYKMHLPRMFWYNTPAQVSSLQPEGWGVCTAPLRAPGFVCSKLKAQATYISKIPSIRWRILAAGQR